MEDNYRTKDKSKLALRPYDRETKTKSRPYDREDLRVKDNKKENKRKVYKNPFDARKAADNEDRQNLREIRAVQAKEMNHGGEAVVQGAGIAIKGTGFKGVF
jgi:hypothetical protein